MRINLVHKRNLVFFLQYAALINAYLICPECSWVKFGSKLFQQILQAQANYYALTIAIDEILLVGCMVGFAGSADDRLKIVRSIEFGIAPGT